MWVRVTYVCVCGGQRRVGRVEQENNRTQLPKVHRFHEQGGGAVPGEGGAGEHVGGDGDLGCLFRRLRWHNQQRRQLFLTCLRSSLTSFYLENYPNMEKRCLTRARCWWRSSVVKDEMNCLRSLWGRPLQLDKLHVALYADSQGSWGRWPNC